MTRGAVNSLFELMRPYQYTKNFFVCLPAFFAFKLNDPRLALQLFLAFIAFSLAASGGYVFNDLVDREKDRQHPEKRRRPIADGRIGSSSALSLMVGLLVASIALMASVSLAACAFLISYIALNVAYTLKLKQVPLVDVTVIAAGFVLRLWVGAATAQVELSRWIIVLAFLLSLFLALAKRRNDVLIRSKTDTTLRKAAEGYNLRFLDNAIIMCASIVVLAYILWSLSPRAAETFGSESLYLTSVFVVLGVLRYMHIAFVEEKSGDPSLVLLKDRFIQLALMGWAGSFVWILYL